MSQAWTVLSGKGGVGKSTVSAALGMALARSAGCPAVWWTRTWAFGALTC